jgi:hypothetical protein
MFILEDTSRPGKMLLEVVSSFLSLPSGARSDSRKQEAGRQTGAEEATGADPRRANAERGSRCALPTICKRQAASLFSPSFIHPHPYQVAVLLHGDRDGRDRLR